MTAAQTREQALQQIVFALWFELRRPPGEQNPDQLDANIRAEGHAWALPTQLDIHPDELLTTKQIADRTGYTESAIRNWPSRYGITQHPGRRYRWADIEQLLKGRHR